MKPDYLALQIPDIALLFEYGSELPQQDLYRLLSFPREDLIHDCRALIQHAYQYEKTYQQALIDHSIEARHLGFVHHAIEILAELEDENALRAIASFLVQNWESYSFWFGNLRPFWAEEVLYLLGKNQLSVMCEMLMDGKGHLFARATAVMALSRAAWVNPARKPEVEGLLMLALEELETWSQALHGTERAEELSFLLAITPVIVEEAHQLGLRPILDKALTLAESESGIGMEAAKIQAKLAELPQSMPQDRAHLTPILERYATLETGFQQVLKENPAPPAPFSQRKIVGPKTPLRKGPKVGRNDLCPCGSGKKYKKCCGQ